jgi:hypothetical protein
MHCEWIFKYRSVKMPGKKKGSKYELTFNGSDLWRKKGTGVLNEFWCCLLKISIKNIPRRGKQYPIIIKVTIWKDIVGIW